MRAAVIADIHANLTAFRAVLGDIEGRGGVDEYWCLGDIVGYGPQPRECLKLLRSLNHIAVAGNHDRGAIGRLDLADFNPDAAAACRWTGAQLGKRDISYLKKLPLTLQRGEFTLVHGSPREPLLEYIISQSIARENFALFATGYCLAGHSHIPRIFREEDGDCLPARFVPEIKLVLGSSRLIINPGSVGQPRDGDPRASYAIYDDEPGIMTLYRVPYNIEHTQDIMMAAGLPVRLVTRLSQGV
jgi:predicted phosphodiesterase